MAQFKALIFGRTGSGKSTVGNVILKSTVFEEGPYSVPQTSSNKLVTMRVEDINITLVDTIGSQDIKLSERQMLNNTLAACELLADGFNQIFLVISGRFTDSEQDVYRILTEIIYEPRVARHITIVRTNFPRFRDPAACAEDKQRMSAESPTLQAIVANCRKVLHVNQPTLVENPDGSTRGHSSLIFGVHIRNCTDVYRPPADWRASALSRVRNYETGAEREARVTREVEVERQRIAAAAAQAEAARKRQQEEFERHQAELKRLKDEHDALLRQHQTSRFCTACNMTIVTFSNGNITIMGNVTMNGMDLGSMFCTTHPHATVTR